MSLANSLKWYAGAVTSSLSPLVPGVGDPIAAAATRVPGRFGLGAARLHPVGMALGAAQMVYLGYKHRDFLLQESQLAADRLTGRNTEEAWAYTPKDRFEARRTHGYLVSPRDRMERNPPMLSSREYWANVDQYR